jgi:tetratricopeptide (TPR) repeat protein
MPHLTDLETAADHITQASKDSNGPSRSPFFFIAGAGVSHPVVPLASGIVDACMDAAHARDRHTEPPSNQPIDVYSHWFQQAYPQPAERQRYLRSLIEDKPIPPANFRLAHLLICRGITNLVVTTNFDDFLSRALTLFGETHIVCDHPATTERIDPERNDIQIVHVHGSYWFYDCCNLRDEIAQRSRPSISTAQTMSALLDRILAHRSPLVVGYSGWEGDVVMSAIGRRLDSSLPYNLYWFCHKSDAIDALPGYLRNHPQVVFVLPPAPGESIHAIEKDPEPRHTLELRPYSASTEETFPPTLTEASSNTISAEAVFGTLIRTAACDEPRLTADPLGFFAAHLRRSLLLPDEPLREPDVYFLRNVVEGIERAKEKESRLSHEVQSHLALVRTALRRSQYAEAISAAQRIKLADLTPSELHELFNAALSVGSATYGQASEEALAASDLIATIGDAPGFTTESPPQIRHHVAIALNRKSVLLTRLDRREEAIATYEQVVERYRDASELSLREQVARALNSKGVALSGLDRHEEAIATYEQVVERYRDASEPSLRERVAEALLFKGIDLGNLDRREEAIATYEQVVERYRDASELSLREQVARALNSKGVALSGLDRHEEAIATYEQVVERYRDASEPSLRERVARALVNKAVALGELSRRDEAIATYEQVVERYRDAPELSLREQVARALSNMRELTARPPSLDITET